MDFVLGGLLTSLNHQDGPYLSKSLGTPRTGSRTGSRTSSTDSTYSNNERRSNHDKMRAGRTSSTNSNNDLADSYNGSLLEFVLSPRVNTQTLTQNSSINSNKEPPPHSIPFSKSPRVLTTNPPGLTTHSPAPRVLTTHLPENAKPAAQPNDISITVEALKEKFAVLQQNSQGIARSTLARLESRYSNNEPPDKMRNDYLATPRTSSRTSSTDSTNFNNEPPRPSMPVSKSLGVLPTQPQQDFKGMRPVIWNIESRNLGFIGVMKKVEYIMIARAGEQGISPDERAAVDELSNEFRMLCVELDNLRIQHEKVLRENGIYVRDLARKTLELDEILQKLDASELLPRVSESRVEALEAEKRQLQTLVDQLEAEKRQLLNTRTEQKRELDEILQKLHTEQEECSRQRGMIERIMASEAERNMQSNERWRTRVLNLQDLMLKESKRILAPLKAKELALLRQSAVLADLEGALASKHRQAEELERQLAAAHTAISRLRRNSKHTCNTKDAVPRTSSTHQSQSSTHQSQSSTHQSQYFEYRARNTDYTEESEDADYRIAQALAIVGTVEDLWELELDEVEVANSHPQRGGGGTRKEDGGGRKRGATEPRRNASAPSMHNHQEAHEKTEVLASLVVPPSPSCHALFHGPIFQRAPSFENHVASESYEGTSLEAQGKGTTSHEAMTSQSRNKHVLVYTSTDESFQLSTTFEIPKSERPKSEEGERTSSYVRLLPLPGQGTSAHPAPPDIDAAI